jgi:hypothetical protein
MTQDFEYTEIAEDVLDEHGQDSSFKTRFVGYCENTIDGSSDDGDLKRLIRSIELEDRGGRK